MKRLIAAVVILSLIIILLVMYIIFFQLQLRNINRQLKSRLTEHTRKPITLEMINSQLNVLAANINKCLKVEENLRLESLRDEKHFKEMIADISHDLRTPLTAIKGYQQLMEKGNLSDEQKKKLKIAEKHADELGSLIEHFFEYSYLLNTDVEPKLKKINLVNLTAGCIAEFVPVLEKNNLEVHFHEVPPVFVIADKEMTIRIIQNLLRNCIQHSDGNIEVQITTDGVLSFRNSVSNASEIDAERIFDRFYTSDKARSKTTGLGLSIVKLLAESMGGSTEAVIKNDVLEIRVGFQLC